MYSPVTSPTAKMFGLLVRIVSSTAMPAIGWYAHARTLEIEPGDVRHAPQRVEDLVRRRPRRSRAVVQ